MTITAFAVPDYSDVHEDVPATFTVTQILAPDRMRKVQAMRIGPSAIYLSGAPAEGARFFWLDFVLPGSNDRIRALGEAMHAPRDAQWTCVRFKHLFPDQRVHVQRFVDAHRTRLAA